jgi:secondary thiamine-phosphate synthase enzyme
MSMDIPVSTNQKIQVLDITADIAAKKRIKDGAILLYVPHTTAGLVINENESNLKRDMERFYGSLAKGSWQHNSIDDNAEAHLVSTALNSSITIPVEKGELVLGTWQSILFVELDGPRERKVLMKELSA